MRRMPAETKTPKAAPHPANDAHLVRFHRNSVNSRVGGDCARRTPLMSGSRLGCILMKKACADRRMDRIYILSSAAPTTTVTMRSGSIRRAKAFLMSAAVTRSTFFTKSSRYVSGRR
jgi:hypothetical protein